MNILFERMTIDELRQRTHAENDRVLPKRFKHGPGAGD